MDDSDPAVAARDEQATRNTRRRSVLLMHPLSPTIHLSRRQAQGRQTVVLFIDDVIHII